MSLGVLNCEAGERIVGKARTAKYIVVFAKHFDIDSATQKPIGDTGRAVVIERGGTLKGWKLDQDRWRYHVGTADNKWAGPVGQVIQNVAQVPGVGNLFTGIFGNWNRERAVGAKTVDIEFRKDGDIIFTTSP